jgi:cytochrome c biogenesis protein ResB
MKLALILVVIIGLLSLLGTIAAARNVESNYGKSSKRNTVHLSAIYIVVLLGSVIALFYYAMTML